MPPDLRLYLATPKGDLNKKIYYTMFSIAENNVYIIKCVLEFHLLMLEANIALSYLLISKITSHRMNFKMILSHNLD